MKTLTIILSTCIGMVWLINGLVCKVLGLVPRHEQIVARILGDEYAREITLVIGLGEVGLAIWFWSRIWPRVNALLQMGLVATMNVLEYFLAPDLLLWGEWNALFAAVFIVVVGYYEFSPRANERRLER